MNSLLFQICTANRLRNTLLYENNRVVETQHRALVARATARLRRLRAFRAPATHLQKRRKISGCQSLQKLIQRHLDMTSQQQNQQSLRRRCSSAADRAPVEPLSGPAATTTTLPPTEHSTAMDSDTSRVSIDAAETATESMPPPPVPAVADGGSPTRQTRSTSLSSRNANRLSLTLPIALPTSDSSRPTPISAVTPSIPPTPVESSGSQTPSGTNEFIIAVAAQERKVLELREELARAEADLVKLKKQWTAQEAAQKRASIRQLDISRANIATQDDEPQSARHSVDLDRRKSLLLNNNTPTSSPGRRRVLRGGHTRTLSLLSPAKSDSGFPVHEDRELRLPSTEVRTAQLINPTLAKRSSWQPRMQHQQLPAGAAMPQLVEDFRLGFRAFVEDIRQITVGDEPINGELGGTSATNDSPRDQLSGSQDNVIRPRGTPKADTMTTFDLAGSLNPTPTPLTRSKSVKREAPKSTKTKRFSWTPLGIDSLDDTDWSNWDSPVPSKPARWSGSTANSSAMEDTPSIPEKEEEAMTTSSSSFPDIEMPLSPARLKEMLPGMVNGFSPSNLKRTATTLMSEWEKSLVPPEERNKENL